MIIDPISFQSRRTVKIQIYPYPLSGSSYIERLGLIKQEKKEGSLSLLMES